MMTNLLNDAHVANKLFSTIARLRLLLVMFLTLTVSAEVLGADNLFNVTSYNSIPSGWTNSSVTTGSYFNFNTNNCSLTSPLYDPHTDLILTYKVATYGSGTNHPLTIQLLDENGNVKQTHTTGTPTSSTYISGTWSIGTVNYKFKIKFYLATAGKGVRLQVPKLVGNPATSTEPYTVTLDAGPGTCAASVTEASAGAGVTLLTPTLECGDWEFAGWTTSAVATETSSKPATLLTGSYKPSNNITLYAVYQRTETTSGGGGSGDYKLVTSAPTDWSGIYLIVDGSSKNCFNGSLTALDAGGNYKSVTISDNTITSNTTTDSYSVTISKSTTNGKYYIKTASGYYIGSTASTSSDGNELKSSTSTKYDNSISISSNNVTIKGPDHILKFFYQSGQSWRFRYYKSTTTSNVRLPQLYKKSAGGSSSTTYYNSTPECNTETTVCVIPKCGGGWRHVASGNRVACDLLEEL